VGFSYAAWRRLCCRHLLAYPSFRASPTATTDRITSRASPTQELVMTAHLTNEAMKHPAIISSIILTLGLLLSAVLISSSLHSLNETIDHKVFGTQVSFPSDLTVHAPNLDVSIANRHVGQPLIIQSKQ